ncbi:MAG: T9SS type A sorting domain-containing protein [Bacteroidota bacterium]
MTTKNTSLKKHLFSLLLSAVVLCLSHSLTAQVTFNLNTSLNGPRDIRIDFEVEDFEELLSMQFAITWDPAKLSFEDLELDEIPETFTFSSLQAASGIIRVVWTDATALGESLTDGSNMFSMYFKALQPGNAEISVGGAPPNFVVEVFQNQMGNHVEIPLIVNGGQILLEGAYITGDVFADANADCLADSIEERLSGWLVEFANGTNTYVFNTDEDGIYRAFLDTGDYTINLITPNDLWTPCQQNVMLTLSENDSLVQNMGATAVLDCPALEVDISTARLRRCFFSHYGIHYCNNGTVDAENAYIEVELDPFLIPITADIPYTEDGNVLTFDLGTVGVSECQDFTLEVLVGCDSVSLGQAHCTTARIFPDTTCNSGLPYNGAILRVDGQCNKTSGNVEFFIENIGAGDMMESVNYVIIEDVIMYAPQPVKLESGRLFGPILLPSNGSTYRLQVPQVSGYPFESMPSMVIEGCGTNSDGSFTMGLVNQFSLNDAEPTVSMDCTENVGSYDPNDKQGFPNGVGDDHLIEANTELEYKIRFQNTGTDTAFRVVILDTISSLLDMRTFRQGSASHPYEFELLSNNIIRFAFLDINLPDSSTNLIGSNGFVTFHIQQQPDHPIGTEITNSAAIYFDFNDPIITNLTLHTIGENFLTLQSQEVFRPGLSIDVYPNPTPNEAVFELSDASFQELTLRLYDASGRLMRTEQHQGPRFIFKRGDLGSGLYFYTLGSESELLSSGKLMVRGR